MKKLILLSVLFLGFLSHAQDYNYIASINSIPSQEAALKVAEEIVSMARDKYRLYKSKEASAINTYSITFVPVGMTDAQVFDAPDDVREKFIKVLFTYHMDGANKDLEIPGTKKYKLSEIHCKYLDLFPYWKKHFRPEADLEKTTTDYGLQRLKDYSRKIDFRIASSDNTWYFRNQS